MHMKKLFLAIALLLTCNTVFASAEKLKANMKVNIHISGVPEKEIVRISSTYLIDGGGYLRLPLLEGVKIKAAGITGSELAVHIADAYRTKKIYSSPVLTVTTFKDADKENAQVEARLRREEEMARLREERRLETQVVHVEGEAKKPGRYKLTVGMTVRALMAECGGDSEWGSNQRFSLKRKGQAEKEYNYKQNPSALSIRLQAGDFIRIPKGTGLLGKK